MRDYGGCRYARYPFEAQAKTHRKLMLALLKMGFRADEIRQMGDAEAMGYCEAFVELRNPQSAGIKKRVAKKVAGNKRR